MTKNKKKAIPPPVLTAGARLVDTHCHLDMDAYGDDLDQVLCRARAAGVGRVITIGIDVASSRAAVALAQQHRGIFAAVGVHPHHVAEVDDRAYAELRQLAAHPRVVAYGEVGMDGVKGYVPLDLQRDHFRRQVVLAKELGLPLIVHDRETHAEVLAILQEAAPFPAGGVMHCFSGDAALAREVLALGFYVSVPGVVTFNNAAVLQEVVAAVPLNALLVETDGPFLAPAPWRGKRNEPAHVLYTAAKVAAVKGVSLDEVARQTTANAESLFGLAEGEQG